jgi:arylsulfatase A-like enzyme
MPHFAGGAGAGGSTECPEDIWSRLFYKGLRGPEQAVDYDEAAVRSALKWLECPPKEPWVLYLPLIFPHCPFQVEEPYFSMYDRSQMPIPVKPSTKTGYEPRYFEANRQRYQTERATDQVWAEIAATYYGMITRLDDQFGRVMDGLKKLDPQGNNTVTIFYTDHGEYLGDHGVVEKWPSGVSEVLSREPLIIGGAGLPQGTTCDEICEMVDLLPTVFQLCGIGEHFPHNGVSLLPMMMEGKEHPKKYAYTEGGFLTSEEPLLEQAPYPYDIKSVLQHEDTTLVGKAVGMRSKKWAYVYRLYEPAELYDRRNDLAELHNLAADPRYAGVIAEMQAEMFRWIMETADILPFQKDGRFPVVGLESPKQQYMKRLEDQNMRAEQQQAEMISPINAEEVVTSQDQD